MLGVFALALPLTVMIKSTANAYVYALVTEPGPEDEPRGLVWNPLSSIRALPYRLSRAAPLVARVWKRAAAVELVVSAISVPLQFASLAVVTLPLTLPLLLSLQCALPLAILEGSPGRQGRGGARGRAATQGHLIPPAQAKHFKFAWTCIASSHSLMKPLRWKLAAPFLAVVVFQRLVEMAQNKLLASMPARCGHTRDGARLVVGGCMLSDAAALLQVLSSLGRNPASCLRHWGGFAHRADEVWGHGACRVLSWQYTSAFIRKSRCSFAGCKSCFRCWRIARSPLWHWPANQGSKPSCGLLPISAPRGASRLPLPCSQRH